MMCNFTKNFTAEFKTEKETQSKNKVYNYVYNCRIKWMNPRACTNEAYIPTSIEHVANVATHGIWVVPSVIGGIELVRRSVTWAQFVSACVYGTSLILVFAVSTFFHSVHYCNHNRYTII